MSANKRTNGAIAEQGAPSAVATSSALDETLHRGHTESQSQGALRAMTHKDKPSHDVAVNEYFQHWDNKDAEKETDDVRQSRTKNYANLTRQYYNFTTDMYEHAWGESFHFCRFGRGESFDRAIARHEHFLAANIGIKSDMRVLDVGCGVGGPAREMVKFTGCHVTGLNINEYQIRHARTYGERDGLSHRLDFVNGDFMNMPFPDASFDAVYAVEATVHAPSLQAVYSEVRRVLKPGGRFGLYEWVMTEDYDNDNMDHRRIRLGIEKAYGIAAMVKMSEARAAIEAAGLELEVHRDLAVNDDKLDVAPWYWTMGGELKHAQKMWDVLFLLRKTWFGAIVSAIFVGVLEAVGIVPAGTAQTADIMCKGGDALVAGGTLGIFTPMYFMVARKPNE